MVDPQHSEALRLLTVPAEALTSEAFGGYLTDIKERLGSTETDRLTLLYATCWYIAQTHSWHYLTRLGDKSFSEPDESKFRRLYVQRCNERGVRAILTANRMLRKSNSELDDYPDNLNP